MNPWASTQKCVVMGGVCFAISVGGHFVANRAPHIFILVRIPRKRKSNNKQKKEPKNLVSSHSDLFSIKKMPRCEICGAYTLEKKILEPYGVGVCEYCFNHLTIPSTVTSVLHITEGEPVSFSTKEEEASSSYPIELEWPDVTTLK